MLEAENYDQWLQAAVAYLTHPLNAYDANPVWKSDPKLSMLKDAAEAHAHRRRSRARWARRRPRRWPTSWSSTWWLRCAPAEASIKDAIASGRAKAQRIYR